METWLLFETGLSCTINDIRVKCLCALIIHQNICFKRNKMFHNVVVELNRENNNKKSNNF